MRAAILHGPRDLRFAHIAPKPVPAPGEVLVRVACAGLCGSDLHVWKTGDFISSFPVVPGHEVVGRVIEARPVGRFDGPGSELVGERVVLDSRVPCGACEWCARGASNRCPSIGFLGEVRGGGFAEWIAVPADRVWVLPARLPYDIAVLAEPTAVALHAWKRVVRAAEAKPKRVAILGAGPVGVLLALAVPPGVEVVLAEPNAVRAEAAQRITGFEVVDPSAAGGLAGTFDAAFDCAGAVGSLGRAADLVAPGGVVGAVALHHKPDELDVNAFVGREVTVTGAHVFADEMPAALRLLGRKPHLFGQVVDRIVSLEELPAAVAAAAEGGADHLKLVVAHDVR